MKTIDKIPTSKIERTTRLMGTGVKVGANYLKYFGEKLVNPSVTKDNLNYQNASDIYDGLKSLKGSALKVAQMLSMEKNLLPNAYVERFSLAQFSVPPLSAPLVRKTFKKYFGNYPEDVFDVFSPHSVNAASIGQVHKAEKNGLKLAVKIQYPGVADSISSDLAIVKPVALKMFNLKGKDTEKYFKEIEEKLLEETDYLLELKRSEEISMACSPISHLEFPKYYSEYSSERILTMDWMEGSHLAEFVKTNFTSETGNHLGQALWDFYMFQIHQLRQVHADPHPGNFLVSKNHHLIAIDFGCVKEIPDEFYVPYFELAQKQTIDNTKLFQDLLFKLEILLPQDTPRERDFFTELFGEMLKVFTLPFHHKTFNFGDSQFWGAIADLSERFSNDSEIRKMNGSRGSKHFLYMNRTFFGLYNLLHDLKAVVQVDNFKKYMKPTKQVA